MELGRHLLHAVAYGAILAEPVEIPSAATFRRAVSNRKGCKMPNRSAISVCLALWSVLPCLASLMPAAHAQDRSDELSWGPLADGLRMSIATTPSSATATTVQFRLAIQNAGEGNTVLNMGLMMANGKVLLPTALFLTITDSQKTTWPARRSGCGKSFSRCPST